MRRMFVALLLAALASLAGAGSAFADVTGTAAVTAIGTFSNATLQNAAYPADFCNAKPLSSANLAARCETAYDAQVRWGLPQDTIRSGLGWNGNATPSVAYGSTFAAGTLTHINYPTSAGTAITGVHLGIVVNVQPSGGSTPWNTTPADAPLTIDETLNQGAAADCPYQPSVTPCADRIGLPSTTATTYKDIPIDNGLGVHFDRYRLDVLGFRTSANSTPTQYLVTQEGSRTAATLAAQLTVKHSAILTLGADQSTATVDSAPFAYSAVSEFSLPVTVSASGACHLADGTVVPDGVGDCVLTASRAETSDYLGDTKSLTIPITKDPTTVQVSDAHATFDGSAHSVTATTDPAGLPVAVTYDGSSTAPTHAGTYAVNASFAGDATHLPSSSTATLTIDKATPALSFADKTVTYDGDPHGLDAPSTDSTATPAFSYDDSGSADPRTGAGSYPATASLPGAGDYLAATAHATLTIHKAASSVSVADATATWDGQPHAGAAPRTTPAGLPTTVSYTDADGTTSGDAPVEPGRYTVRASTDGDGNHDGSSATGTLTIVKAPSSVGVADRTVTYDGSPQSVAAAATPGTLPVAVTYDGSPDAPTHAGSYQVVASTPGDAHHEPSSATATLTITKAPSHVSVGDATVTWDGGAQRGADPVTDPAGLATTVTWSAAGGQVSTTPPSEVGTYTVTAATDGDRDHDGSSGTGTLTIAKAASHVDVADRSVTFDGTPPRVPATTTPGSLPVTVTYDGAADAPTHAGSYAVVATTPGDAHHDGSSASARLTIAKATPSVTLSGLSATYDASPHAASAAVTGVGGADLGSAAVAYDGGGAPVAAGSYPVHASYAGGGDYAPATASGTLTIAKRALRATADDAVRDYGQPNPVLTGTLTGVQGSDGITASYATTATSTSAPGTYPIAVTLNDPNGKLANYAVTTTPGTLRVRYAFGGFVAPVDAPPTVNVVKAGSAIPVKFSLGQNFGLGVLASGAPYTTAASCTTGAPVDDIEETVSADSSSLSWDGSRYQYVWKTSSAWTGTCRVLHVALADGSDHTALFRFK